MADEGQKQEDPWQFVTVDQYRAPPEIVDVGSVKRSFLSVVRRIAGTAPSESSPLDPEEDLHVLTGEQLDRAVPAPDWVEGAAALQERLRPWLEAERPSKPVVFYVAPPHAGRNELLAQWARHADIAVVEEATEDQILSVDGGWFRSWPKADRWLLPRLERCFLREAEGLDLVRELLAQMLSGELGRGVIGCDSWAWTFLQHVWLGRPSFTICAQAFDAARLKDLFSRGFGGETGAAPDLRQADTGAYLLSEQSDETHRRSTNAFWRRLAARSRGNPGVAIAYWRRALRTLPEREIEDNESEERRLRRETIWVTPWEDLGQPAMPGEAGETASFVLHALLLHDGLRIDRLAAILPSDRTAITEALLFLAEADLVTCEGEYWQVTAYGYPVVRSALMANDYLCDPF